MRAWLLLLPILVMGCGKKNDAEPAAKPKPAAEAPADEGKTVTPVKEEPKTVTPVKEEPVSAERGSCTTMAERVVELALQKEEEPAFRKKDIEGLTEGCLAAEDIEAKTKFGECITGAADLEAAKKDCDLISSAKAWLPE